MQRLDIFGQLQTAQLFWLPCCSLLVFFILSLSLFFFFFYDVEFTKGSKYTNLTITFFWTCEKVHCHNLCTTTKNCSKNSNVKTNSRKNTLYGLVDCQTDFVYFCQRINP